MKKLPLLIAGAVLAGGVSIAALAAESETQTEQTATAMEHESAAMGAHSMSGTIEKIDHETGEVVLKSEPMNLTLHFPPDTIKDLKEGEKIVVHLAFSIEE